MKLANSVEEFRGAFREENGGIPPATYHGEAFCSATLHERSVVSHGTRMGHGAKFDHNSPVT